MTKLETEAEIEWDAKHFEKTGKWQANYFKCRSCGWATSKKDEMLRHIAERKVILKTLTDLQKQLGGTDSANCARSYTNVENLR